MKKPIAIIAFFLCMHQCSIAQVDTTTSKPDTSVSSGGLKNTRPGNNQDSINSRKKVPQKQTRNAGTALNDDTNSIDKNPKMHNARKSTSTNGTPTP